jgi:hypothetical protein
VAGTEKRRSTEPRNTVTIGVTATADSTFEWREEGAQVTFHRPSEFLLWVAGPNGLGLQVQQHEPRDAPVRDTEQVAMAVASRFNQ